jgi:hypothetical protein
MKGRLLTAKEINKLKEGDIVYIKPILKGYENEEGKAKVVYDEDNSLCALPINAQNIEEEAWELEDYKDNDSKDWLAIYEWVEDKQKPIKETTLNKTDLKVGDCISFKLFGSAKGYFIGTIDSINIEKNTIWGYWSSEEVKELPKTIKEFNGIVKDERTTWITFSNIINSIKKLNLIDDTKDSTQFTKENLKTGMWIECRNKQRYMTMFNVFGQRNYNVLASNEGWLEFDSYQNNLLHNRGYKEWDIIKVYKAGNPFDIYKGSDLDLIWERKEEKPKNHIDQTVNRTFTYNNETIILTQHENETEVKLTDGTVATTYCDENTEFDRDKGLDIAYWKAKRIQADSMLSKVKGYIDDVCDMNKTLTGSKIQDKIQEDVDDAWL